MFDVLQYGWHCKVVRYFGVAFPSITINNLIAISTERFLSTRDVPKSFSGTTVRKLVYAAWIAGFLIVLAPTATMNLIRYDINATHYTVVCKPDTSYLPYRVLIVVFVLTQQLIPSIALICTNIIIARRLWKRGNRRINVQQDNSISARRRYLQIKGSSLLTIVTLAFVIPYSLLPFYFAFVVVAKPSVDFLDDFVMRYFSAVLFISSSAINFIIHLVQMNDFRAFLRKVLCRKGLENAPP